LKTNILAGVRFSFVQPVKHFFIFVLSFQEETEALLLRAPLKTVIKYIALSPAGVVQSQAGLGVAHRLEYLFAFASFDLLSVIFSNLNPGHEKRQMANAFGLADSYLFTIGTVCRV
jgi:hypothetical protein